MFLTGLHVNRLHLGHRGRQWEELSLQLLRVKVRPNTGIMSAGFRYCNFTFKVNIPKYAHVHVLIIREITINVNGLLLPQKWC